MKTLLLLTVFLLFQSQLQSQEYKGKILQVKDGDTFVLQVENAGNIVIRMDGIDAPESDQAFGIESKEFLNKYLYKECSVIKKGLDRYGRTIGILYIDSININLLSVKNGLAWHYKKYSTDVDIENAEIEARNKKLGLWLEDNPIPPWDWRHRK